METIPGDLEVISVGDSQHEREALFRVSGQHRVKFVAKSFKLLERPTIDDLKKQHDCIQSSLDEILAGDLQTDKVFSAGHFVDFVEKPGDRHRRPESLQRARKAYTTQTAGSKIARFHSPPRIHA